MSIYDRLNSQPNMQDMMRQIQSDPMGMARQAGYQIPENLAGNPQAMVQHLMQTGQVGGQKLQQAMQMMQRMGLR
jgi:hypothetical protein